MRRVLTLLSVFSLLLCLAFASMSVGLFRCNATLRSGRSHTEYFLILSGSDGITFRTMRWVKPLATLYRAADLALVRTGPVQHTFCPGSTSRTRLLGFEFLRSEGRDPGRTLLMTEYQTSIPFWAAALVFAMLPTFQAFVVIRIRRRISRGLCYACAYDLRASKDICPECGTPISFEISLINNRN